VLSRSRAMSNAMVIFWGIAIPVSIFCLLLLYLKYLFG